MAVGGEIEAGEAGLAGSGGGVDVGDDESAEGEVAGGEEAAEGDASGETGGAEGSGEAQKGEAAAPELTEAQAELAAQKVERERIARRKAEKGGPIAAGGKLSGTAADLLAAVRAVESGEKPASAYAAPPSRSVPGPGRRPERGAPDGSAASAAGNATTAGEFGSGEGDRAAGTTGGTRAAGGTGADAGFGPAGSAGGAGSTGGAGGAGSAASAGGAGGAGSVGGTRGVGGAASPGISGNSLAPSSGGSGSPFAPSSEGAGSLFTPSPGTAGSPFAPSPGLTEGSLAPSPGAVGNPLSPSPTLVNAVRHVLISGSAPESLAAQVAVALGEGAAELLREDPWQLLRVSGVRPEQADGFARALLGAECGPADERRGRAVTLWLLEQAALAGHTALELSALTAALAQRGVPDTDGAVQDTVAEGEALIFQDALEEPGAAPAQDDDEERPVRVLVGLERYALAEESLADGLARIVNALPKDDSPAWETAASAAPRGAADLIRAVAANGLVLHTGGEASRAEPPVHRTSRSPSAVSWSSSTA
ncbi:helix-hairpin-helix domain-containing protein, partial [Streptomyces acidiscabies]|uniref:helix-hairpin-helix domain-containing protein n=1 Tax=Streptomyces acidiscabies TaxID=42234 RepID=UPI00351AC668